ncbi:MAG TPA: hypothetical protein VF800_01570 [Telluria sp.]
MFATVDLLPSYLCLPKSKFLNEIDDSINVRIGISGRNNLPECAEMTCLLLQFQERISLPGEPSVRQSETKPIKTPGRKMAKVKQHTMTLAVAALLAAAGPGLAIAGPVVHDFDRFADGTVLSSQYAGLSFSQATVLTAGASLNELAFPPRSLDGVVFDDGGPITITFLTPVLRIGGYFTYLSGLTVSAYDVNGVLLDTGSAAYAINLADGSGDPGSSPNEFVQVANAAGLISYVTLTSHAGGASFVVDDLTIEAGVAIPAPSTIALTFAGLCAALLVRFRLRRS